MHRGSIACEEFRACWLWARLYSPCANLACQGFDFHHAEPGYVMLTQWLPTDEPCMLPPNASHQVGFLWAPDRIDSYLLTGKPGVSYQEKGCWKV